MKHYLINKENTAWRLVDGEVVIINGATTHYYSMNATGTYIWNLLQEDEAKVETICYSLTRCFQAVPDNIRDDVAKLMDQLVEEDLVVEEQMEPAETDSISPQQYPYVIRDRCIVYDPPELQKYDTLEKLIVSAE